MTRADDIGTLRRRGWAVRSVVYNGLTMYVWVPPWDIAQVLDSPLYLNRKRAWKDAIKIYNCLVKYGIVDCVEKMNWWNYVD